MNPLGVLQEATAPRALAALFGAAIPDRALASAQDPLPPPLAGEGWGGGAL
jgi:hypothetical protein